jgi:hypothetical protein
MALGSTTIPAPCWDNPYFKQCNADGWKIAEQKCLREGVADQKYGGDWVKCKSELAADYAYFGCALRLCPPPAVKRPLSSGGWTWAAKTSNPSIKTFQDHLNIALAKEGFRPIVADGRLGPATCGAFAFVAGKYPSLFAGDPIENIGICQSFTNPTKIGKTTPEKSPTSKEGEALDEKYAGLPWMVLDSRAPGLQSDINRQLDANEYLPIPKSGMLDPPMCGAMIFLDQISGTRWLDSWGPIETVNCPATVMPQKRPGAPPPVVPGPAPAPKLPDSDITKPAVTTAAVSGASILGVGLLAAVAVGGYAYWKYKTGGA